MIEKAIRLEILKYYYSFNKRKPSAQAQCEDFTEEFGITHEELEGHIRYLDEKGLIKCIFALHGRELCRITAKGIDAIENPEQFASEAPFLNLVIHGDVINSQILQAQDIRIANGFNKVYQAIEKSELDAGSKEALKSEVKELEHETTGKKIDLGRVKDMLSHIKKLEGRIFEIIAPVVSDAIKKYLGL